LSSSRARPHRHPEQPPYVAVIGPDAASDEELASAHEVGRELGRAGAVVVCGGLGGVMEAACRGAREAGAITVGILPGESRSAANPWVAVALPTGLGELRNGLVVRAADALIAIGGAYGTLSEIALALKSGRPVFGLDTWDLARAGQPDPGIVRVSSPSEAVTRALAAARGPG
jgi:uncharacterized protein (TIGR00725 family)